MSRADFPHVSGFSTEVLKAKVCYALPHMDEAPKKPITVVELGRIGGQARAKKLSPKRRKQIAIKASKAAAKKRTAKAKQKKARHGS